jgi:ABC-2 type transport system ATP-binding protein
MSGIPRKGGRRPGAKRPAPGSQQRPRPPAAHPATGTRSDPGPPGGSGTTPDPDAPPIRTRGLTKTYGELVAVDHLDLEVAKGEIFGLLGQNGAGKTTTILMLLGLTEPTDGQARVVGLDPARRPLEVKRRVGYLPDSVGFYGGMTGRENLRYTARLNGLDGKEGERTIDEVLEQVGLTARADSQTQTYSRGMLQRLGIADALVKDPDVLILDEPTTAIDPLGVVEILDLLRALVTEREMSILLSSHLLSQVQSVCDRVGIFAAGRLVGVGTVGELAHRFGDGKAHVEVGLETGDAAEADRAEAALRAIDGVAEVRRGDRPTDAWTLMVQPVEASTRVRQAILATSASSGLHLTSVRSVEPSLDDIYRTAVVRRGGSSRVAA